MSTSKQHTIIGANPIRESPASLKPVDTLFVNQLLLITEAFDMFCFERAGLKGFHTGLMFF